jgi:hypothetical protein
MSTIYMVRNVGSFAVTRSADFQAAVAYARTQADCARHRVRIVAEDGRVWRVYPSTCCSGLRLPGEVIEVAQ